MQILHLVSPIPPSVNHYLKARGIIKYKGKRPYVMVTMYTTEEAKRYKEEFAKYVKQEVIKQGWDIGKTLRTHHYLDCIYYFPRIDMDEQNYYKCMCDAMNDIAYVDDSAVLTRTLKVLYDTENPRVEMVLYRVPYYGIFDNESDADTFKASQCTNCKRYKRNCSILKNAIAGHVQKDIDTNTLKCKAKRS